MNLPIELGYAAFFLIPLLLWGIAILATKRNGSGARAFSIIAGSDNRLSLARLQALAWTLVIFGSYVAAMTIHNHITVGSPAEREKAKADTIAAMAKVEDRKKKAQTAEEDVAKTAVAKSEADEKLVKAAEVERITAANPNLSDADKPKAKAAAETARKEAATKAEDLNKELIKKNTAATEAKNAVDQAAKEAEAANLKAKSYNWVDIPGALLMLAGIAIGSGVFSSLISALNGEDKTARVTSIKQITSQELNFKSQTQTAQDTKSDGILLITGKDLGAKCLVKLGEDKAGDKLAPVLFWKADGTEVAVDLVGFKNPTSLIMETPNGKLCYKLEDGLKLGDLEPYYEFADLFRDDKNPKNLDLMKFQMFGWTVIAILIYSYVFLFDLRKDLDSLPDVPTTIAILTGISQAGYLTGKGVSNVSPNEKK
jgi:hypothetical protein